MADLVSLDEFKAFLDVSGDAENALLQGILDAIEALLEEQCGRTARPFRAEQTARVELHDGTGTPVLLLGYPASALTSITLGRVVATPDETLDLTAASDAVSWSSGKRLVRRTDGGIFGEIGEPNYVRVTYNAADDRPPSAALAVKRVSAAVYRQIGAEDATSERNATYSRDLAKVADDDPVWRMAISAQWEPRV